MDKLAQTITQISSLELSKEGNSIKGDKVKVLLNPLYRSARFRISITKSIYTCLCSRNFQCSRVCFKKLVSISSSQKSKSDFRFLKDICPIPGIAQCVDFITQIIRGYITQLPYFTLIPKSISQIHLLHKPFYFSSSKCK